MSSRLVHQCYKVRELILSDQYSPRPYYAKKNVANNLKVRELLVPPFIDKVMQYCVSQPLAAYFESKYYRHSYGYRKGYSRHNAAEQISYLIRNRDYKWVIECDIKNFFDSVPHDKLFAHLASIVQFPEIIKLIQQWLTCASDENVTNKNTGLPIGCPISPVLSNIYLDIFDHQFIAQHDEPQLIRFADDFVILCQTYDQACQILPQVNRLLEQLGLDLHEDKTKITAIERGFKFLGFSFVNDLVVDIHKQKIVEQHSSPDEHFTEKNKSLQAMGKKNIVGIQPVLIVAGERTLLSLSDKRIIINQRDNQSKSMLLGNISFVVIVGRQHQLTTQLIFALFSNDIPVYFLSENGRFQGTLTNQSEYEKIRCSGNLQHEFSIKTDYPLEIAIALVVARINGMIVLLRRRKVDTTALKNFRTKAFKQTNLASLRGIEGACSKLYWHLFNNILPSQWQFTVRSRRPAKDATNALLNLGYSTLYAWSDSLIRLNGLVPEVGIYHQSSTKYSALAADMMEPIRFYVERTVISMINLGQFSRGDFYLDNGACIIKHPAIKRFLSSLYQKLLTDSVSTKYHKSAPPIQHLHRQITSLKQRLLDPEAHFEAFSIS